MRILPDDQPNLLRTAPPLQLLLSGESSMHILIRLPIQQPCHIVLIRESLEVMEFMLEDPLVEIATEPDVECSRETAHDVDAIIAAVVAGHAWDSHLKLWAGLCQQSHSTNSFPIRPSCRRSRGCFDCAVGPLRVPTAPLSMTKASGFPAHPPFITIGSMSDSLIIAGRSFRSRLIVGTGKYKSFQETARALEASGAEMVTVAVRRVNLDRSKESLLDYIDPKKYFLLPNTAGCYTADEAIRAARLGREVGISDWVKLEVIGDQATLYPDVQATLEATRVLVKEGFTVLPYTSDDIVFAKRLIDAGAATIMPLGAPIGSGLGIQNQAHIRILREMITGVPLIVDAGVGTASDATVAMELGADAVLMNTGIANAQDPVLMAEAMKHAVVAGRQAYMSGRMPKKLYATASSPVEGVVR